MLEAFGRSIPTSGEEILTEPCALIVWDMQEGIARRATNIETLLQTIPELLDAARRQGRPIIYSQHYSSPLQYEDRAWLRMLWEGSGRVAASELSPAYLPGSPGWEFIAEIAPKRGDLVIPKNRPNFFIGTPLRATLSALGVDAVVLAGVATERGVLATARDAGYQGVLTVVAADAVGSFSEPAHVRGLEELTRISVVKTTAEIIGAWSQ